MKINLLLLKEPLEIWLANELNAFYMSTIYECLTPIRTWYLFSKTKSTAKKKDNSVFTLTAGWFFFRWCGQAMWPTMFTCIRIQMLRTFYFSFPLWRHGLPSYSFNFTFVFSALRIKECRYCSIIADLF